MKHLFFIFSPTGISSQHDELDDAAVMVTAAAVAAVEWQRGVLLCMVAAMRGGRVSRYWKLWDQLF